MIKRQITRMTDLEAIRHLDEVRTRIEHTYRIKQHKTTEDLKRIDSITVAQQSLAAWSEVMRMLDEGHESLSADSLKSIYKEIEIADSNILHYYALIEEDFETVPEGYKLRKEEGPLRDDPLEATTDLIKMIQVTGIKHWKASVQHVYPNGPTLKP